jgi:hypothetical protein
VSGSAVACFSSQPNPAFKRDCRKARQPLNFTLGNNIGGSLMLKTLLAITMMFSASICIAEQACENLAKKVLGTKGDQSSSWIGSICKAKPDDSGKSFLVVDRQLLLVDRKNGHILSQGELGSTSNSIDSIDTGRYWLAPKVRAFGIRSSKTRSSFQSGSTIQALNLYVTEGKSIRPVLEMLYIGWSVSRTECNDKDECTNSEDSHQLAIDIAKTSHNGFADLIVENRLLKYDGTRYVVPDGALVDPNDP